MAETQRQTISKIQEDVGTLKTNVAVIQNDMGYIKGTAEKMEKFIDDNKGGITFASVLNSRTTTVIAGGIVAAAIYFASKIGGGGA